ncbi:MAG TPA: putative nucleotidyltransferase substrate binding domain-containing protein [Vicinamibacterales bacterium]|nr:putative nucleotidyltransferase substrate binding domain-containing protein [Vicinamibacterales bacterium]
MDTSEIRYRVADFLKQHPPFNAVDDADLVALAAHGRVRFFPNDEFLAWQGEPHKTHILVIQQGTVSLWDEQGGQAELRDVRGPGDWIGAEQFHGARSCLYTARANTDVVTYGFPAYDVEALLEKYPAAAAFVAAMGSVDSGFTRSDAAADPLTTFLQQLAGPLRSCSRETTVREAARLLLDSGAEALAVTDDSGACHGVLTATQLLAWIATGSGDADQTIAETGFAVPGFAGPETTVAEGALRMASSGAVAMTADGQQNSRLLTVLTPRDLLPALGDQPAAILESIARAGDPPRLRALNQRARAFVLKYLTGAESAEWMLGYTARVDAAILTRVFDLTAPEGTDGCWCVWGAWGRGGSLVPRIPHLLWMQEGAAPSAAIAASYERLMHACAECGYLPGPDTGHAPSFYVARVEEWRRRFVGWMRNPVLEGMQRSRALFDLRWVSGSPDLTAVVQRDVQDAVDRDILQILAHDCLADLPPLSFYEDAVVEHSGEVTSVFRLQRNVLQPLVDLGRVFGMAAGTAMGSSTFERFAAARRLLPEHERIFREASEALRVVLWQQGRVGISQGTIGAELPPSVMSRHDRHRLKSTFPVIQRLIEFAANPSWLDAVDVAVDRTV